MNKKYWWVLLLGGLIAINYLASLIHYRIDLTSENRYTLSSPTKKLLNGLNDQVVVDIFLAGDLPADFRNLRNNAEELLQEFKENSNSVAYRFHRPGEGMAEQEKEQYLLYLDSLGIKGTNVKVQLKAGESQEERLVYPSALVTYKDRVRAIDLLQGQD
ncbi:MAG: gliding motility-associated ABC transporter substrate-binding protein GldG, partial [Sphingobacteriales bacterium]